jgi:hypothetical protein
MRCGGSTTRALGAKGWFPWSDDGTQERYWDGIDWVGETRSAVQLELAGRDKREGWYRDPDSPGNDRYWDGYAWTDRVVFAWPDEQERTRQEPAAPLTPGRESIGPADPGEEDEERESPVERAMFCVDCGNLLTGRFCATCGTDTRGASAIRARRAQPVPYRSRSSWPIVIAVIAMGALVLGGYALWSQRSGETSPSQSGVAAVDASRQVGEEPAPHVVETEQPPLPTVQVTYITNNSSEATLLTPDGEMTYYPGGERLEKTFRFPEGSTLYVASMRYADGFAGDTWCFIEVDGRRVAEGVDRGFEPAISCDAVAG